MIGDEVLAGKVSDIGEALNYEYVEQSGIEDVDSIKLEAQSTLPQRLALVPRSTARLPSRLSASVRMISNRYLNQMRDSSMFLQSLLRAVATEARRLFECLLRPTIQSVTNARKS